MHLFFLEVGLQLISGSHLSKATPLMEGRSSWVITRVHKATSRPPAVSRVMQLLGLEACRFFMTLKGRWGSAVRLRVLKAGRSMARVTAVPLSNREVVCSQADHKGCVVELSHPILSTRGLDFSRPEEAGCSYNFSVLRILRGRIHQMSQL